VIKVPYVTVIGGDTFEVQNGKKLVLALEDNGVNILHRCGGNAKCTTCRVEVLAGDYLEVTSKEKNAFTNIGIDDQLFEDCLRLSCQIRINGDITVRPIMTAENTGKSVGPRPAD
jgi:ferredoxin